MAQRWTRKRTVNSAFGLVVAGAVLLVVSYTSLGLTRQPPVDSESATDVAVAVARVVREDLSQKLTLTAEFRPYREIDLHAKVAGYVREIRVEVGDHVREGQVIAVLDIPEFSSDLHQASAATKRSESDVLRARSDVRRAQSVLDAARLTHERLAAVSGSRPKLLAQQEVDDALARMRVAEAQLDMATAGLAVAEEQVRMQEATETRARTMSDYKVITAPFSGLITRRYADRGAMIQAGTSSQTQAMPVVRLSQVDRLRLVLPVPESVVARAEVGHVVKVTVPALEQTFDGTVARITGRVDAATRTMETEVDIANPQFVLKPGMFASADLALEVRHATLTVPVQAVTRLESKSRVTIVNADNLLEHRDVTTGLESSHSVEIVSGLAENERVVVSSQGQLRPGQAVEPKEATLAGRDSR